MTRPYGPMYRDFLALRAELASLDEKLKSLKSISSSPVGCVTFTANHGSSVMSQIRGEIDSLANIMARRRLRTLEGGSIDTRILNTTDSALISYVKSNPAEVPEGSVRQYFVEESRAVCEVIEFPSNYLQIRIGKGQAASTHGMLRLKSFNTTSLESFVNSKRKKHSSTEAQIKHSVEETLLKSTNPSVATNMWSKSATDLGSEGGFLICTESNPDYRIMFCPKCSQELINHFHHGTQEIVFPPLPKTILNLNLFCTENIHKDHSYEDCMEVTDLESRINQIREKFGAHPHHTEVIHIENHKLSQSHGTWAWLKHN